MNIQSWIKPEILSQPAYHVKTVDYRIKLNQNESPWDIPLNLKQKISEQINRMPWHRYPELSAQSIREKIAEVNGLAADNIVVGKGSNEVLQAIVTASLNQDSTLCILSPTFAIYRMLGEHLGVKIVTSTSINTFQYNEADLLEKATKANLTILCNPNSPTGAPINPELILTILQSTNGLVVIDEAYFEFYGETSLPLLARYPNLIITRTFSKVFSLGGFRAGYAMMSEKLAEQIQKCMLPFNIDSPTAIAIKTILDYTEQFQGKANQIIQFRERLITDINTLNGFTAYSSATNFFLLKSSVGPKKLFKYLSEQGILIRDVSHYPSCEKYVRVTVGTPQENQELIRTLKKLS